MNSCAQCGKKTENETGICTLCTLRLNGQYAGFFARFFALIIDNVILTLFIHLLSILLNGEIIFTPNGLYVITPWLLFVALIPLIYGALFESSSLQATPGKMLMRIYVANTSGERISFRRALLRQLVRDTFSLILNLGFLLALLTRNKQTLHDLLAQTIVLKHGRKN